MIRIRIRINTTLITNELNEEKMLFLRHLESSELEQQEKLSSWSLNLWDFLDLKFLYDTSKLITVHKSGIFYDFEVKIT